MRRPSLPGFIALILLGLLLTTAGCISGSPKAPAPYSADPAAVSLQETLVVGIDSDYPPFSYLNSSGSPTGFDVDSMQWIAQKKGLKVKFQPTAWDSIIISLLTGKIDLVYSGMSITPERAGMINFSTPYWEVNQDVVARNDSALTLKDVTSGTAIIGTQSGSTAAVWVDTNLVSTGRMSPDRLVLYNNTPLALDDLAAGRVDAVMYDDYILKTMIGEKPLKTLGTIGTKEGYGIAVRKSDPELLATLNDGLTQLKADPYWQELIIRYKMKQNSP
ncbi:ABC transporter substrate-binding protein [Methanoregula sp.]|uniref:ABC transporter substrate-binding protein n=1 Tax=Methanoregula sp. TaxID=2052170 RepID=UPI00236F5203|nr:ABC transporter substrate-binding protein [Methanoregula sp.]MDD1686192.1 ABC transporter substrate-binding protein [Methanoregula sp.]